MSINYINLNEPKKPKRRNRKPVKPTFILPPRGDRCINWLPIAKREIKKRISDLGGHRLKVVELSINKAITNTFKQFNLSYPSSSIIAVFELDCDAIISALITEWETKLLSQWKGPKLKTSTWSDKLWEGKNGYWKLCKNWADQNKYQVSHIFWVKVYGSINIYIQQIANIQYPLDNISLSSLNPPFLRCLMYSCLYGIFSSKIGFPKTRLLPLLVNTVIAKNGEVKRYLKNEFDADLTIYRWKEQESEKYDGISNTSTDNKVCAAVKERCIQYTAYKMEKVFNSFYRSIHINGDMDKLDLNHFIVSVVFDAKGNITKKRVKSKVISSKKKESNKTKKIDGGGSGGDDVMMMMMNEEITNYGIDDIKSDPSDSSSSPSYQRYNPYHYEDENVSTTVSIPAPDLNDMNNNNNINDNNMNNNNNNNNRYSSYGGSHGQSGSVRYNRCNPTNAAPSIAELTSSMYHSVNAIRNMTNMTNMNHMNNMNGLNCSCSASSASSSTALQRAQRTNDELRQQIAECKRMLAVIGGNGRNTGYGDNRSYGGNGGYTEYGGNNMNQYNHQNMLIPSRNMGVPINNHHNNNNNNNNGNNNNNYNNNYNQQHSNHYHGSIPPSTCCCNPSSSIQTIPYSSSMNIDDIPPNHQSTNNINNIHHNISNNSNLTPTTSIISNNSNYNNNINNNNNNNNYYYNDTRSIISSREPTPNHHPYALQMRLNADKDDNVPSNHLSDINRSTIPPLYQGIHDL